MAHSKGPWILTHKVSKEVLLLCSGFVGFEDLPLTIFDRRSTQTEWEGKGLRSYDWIPPPQSLLLSRGQDLPQDPEKGSATGMAH